MPDSRPDIAREPIRIVGQGLTGSLLALLLDTRGIPFVVQDVPLPGASTPVAPGIVNPLAGRKFAPPANIDRLVEDVRDVFELAEKVLQVKLWNTCPILRVFADPAQIGRFEKGLTDGTSVPFVECRHAALSVPGINDTFGSFSTSGGGWANLPLLKSATRAWLKNSGRLLEEAWQPEDRSPNAKICFCEGWQVLHNRLWDFIPHNPAKGEMLIVEFTDPLPRHQIYNQSCWVQPIEDRLWRVGATYSWSDFNSQPSPEGVADLKDRLRLLTAIPFKIVDQVAGVRPIVEDYMPVIGEHPQHKDWFILNAMGSKGVLQAPHAAKACLNLLAHGTPPPPQWNLNRFLP